MSREYKYLVVVDFGEGRVISYPFFSVDDALDFGRDREENCREVFVCQILEHWHEY
jgi:hypothetical protein